MTISPLTILFAILLVAALVYLVWWARHYFPYRTARHLAARAAAGELTAAQTQQLLDHAILLNPHSAEYEAACLGLSTLNSADMRLKLLLGRYFETHPVTPANAQAARCLAGMLFSPTADHGGGPNVARPNPLEAGNAAGLLDALIDSGQASPADLELRSRLALQALEISPQAIQAVYQSWVSMPAGSSREPLTRFLYTYYSATWEAAKPAQDNGTPGARPELAPEVLTRLSAVFASMADIPPADLAVRLLAIQAARASSDALTCFRQCMQARQEFGAPALPEEVWEQWGESIISLEGGDWEAYSRRAFAHLPADAPWGFLQEVFDHLHDRHPENDAFLIALAWTLCGAQSPILRCLAEFEHLLGRSLPVPPAVERLAAYYDQQREWQSLEKA